jgi:carboxymethylenebutenolidase
MKIGDHRRAAPRLCGAASLNGLQPHFERRAMSKLISLTAAHDGFSFTALHAEPQGERKGGVIVIQEIFGLDRYVQEDVARWSARGFEVVAPSMFDRQEKGFVAGHDPEGFEKGRNYAMANGADNAMGDIAACIAFLKARGPVFLVGYCYGGTMGWLAASRLAGLSAVSSYYGGGVAGMAALPLATPLIKHLGLQDAHIPADEVKAAIHAHHPEVEVFIYEGSGHGFNNDGVPAQDPADAELARRRTVDFFARHA